MSRSFFAAVVLVMFLGCPAPDVPTLTLSVFPKVINDARPAQVRAIATVNESEIGTGTVSFETESGELGDDQVALDEYGTAQTTLICDPRVPGGCESSFKVTAKWKHKTETITETFVVTSAIAADAGPRDGGVDAGVNYLCTAETAPAPRLSGRYVPYLISDLEGLCGGRVMVADTTNRQLRVVYAANGSTERSYSLTGIPSSFDIDRARKVAVYGTRDRGEVNAIDLVTGTSSTVLATGRYASIVAVAAQGGSVYAIANPDAGSNHVVVRLTGGVEELPGRYRNEDTFLALDRSGTKLFLANNGLSPATLVRIDTASFTVAQTSTGYGSNGNDLIVSPDGQRLAFSVGSGNGGVSPYSTSAISTADLNQRLEEYPVSAYPGSADFSADGTRFVASNYSALRLFDSANQTLIRERTKGDAWRDAGVPTGGCSGLTDIAFTRFSPGNGYVYGWTPCTTAGGVIFMDSSN